MRSVANNLSPEPKKYADDPNLAALAAGTPVHFLCYEFKDRELVRLEEIDPR